MSETDRLILFAFLLGLLSGIVVMFVAVAMALHG